MHFLNIINKNYLFVFIFTSAVLHLIASIYSIGFYSDDEHFQILEIAAYLKGLNQVAINDPTGYYWEWEEKIRMRPWLQPYIFFKIINFLEFFSSNPFIWTLILRLISSVIGFTSIILLYFTFKDLFFKKNKIFNTFLFFTFWFYPFIHSRTSSENISIAFFVIGFCLLYKLVFSNKLKTNYFVLIFASFFMGISMVFKFTTVFNAFPYFIWMLFFKFNLKKIFIFGFFILIALCIGLYVDYINWGSFKNTYYQFYLHNLSSGVVGRMKYFGIEPWYYYFIEIIKQLAPLLSLFFLLGLILFWVKKPQNAVTWITFPSFIIFTIIGHKEIRYMFPIYIFAPFFISYFLNLISIKNIKKIFQFIIILSNLVFLFLTLTFPANSKVGVYKFLFENHNTLKIYFTGENPYQINNMEPFFYTNSLPKIENFNENHLTKSPFLLVTNDYHNFKYRSNLKCKMIYSTYPSKIINLNKNWSRLKINWQVHKCKYN